MLHFRFRYNTIFEKPLKWLYLHWLYIYQIKHNWHYPSKRNVNNTRLQIKRKEKQTSTHKHVRIHVNGGREAPKNTYVILMYCSGSSIYTTTSHKLRTNVWSWEMEETGKLKWRGERGVGGERCGWKELWVKRTESGESLCGESCGWKELWVKRAVVGESWEWRELRVERAVGGESWEQRELYVERAVDENSWEWRELWVERTVSGESCGWKKSCEWRELKPTAGDGLGEVALGPVYVGGKTACYKFLLQIGQSLCPWTYWRGECTRIYVSLYPLFIRNL